MEWFSQKRNNSSIMKAMAASEATKRVHAKKSPPPMAAAGLLGPYLARGGRPFSQWNGNHQNIPFDNKFTLNYLRNLSSSSMLLNHTSLLLQLLPPAVWVQQAPPLQSFRCTPPFLPQCPLVNVKVRPESAVLQGTMPQPPSYGAVWCDTWVVLAQLTDKTKSQ